MKYSILLLVIISLLYACNDCENTTLTRISLESEYGCQNTVYSDLELDVGQEYVIIKDQNTYNNTVNGSCQPDIDFTSFDLLIGEKGINRGLGSIEYDLIQNCETENLELTVTITKNINGSAPVVVFHTLLPKLGGEQEVEVDLIVIEPK